MKRAIAWIRRAKPADWLRLIKKLLPHAAIIISGMLIVFFVIDRFNKPMGFMTNEFHKRLTFALALLALYFAVQLISLQRRAERAEYRRRLREAQERQAARKGAGQTSSADRPDRPAARAAGSAQNVKRRTP